MADSTTLEQQVPSQPKRKFLRLQETMIWVTFQKIGFHRYPQAPDAVTYLRDPHRHNFHFKVGIQVHHDDREIEFHMFQSFIMGLYAEGVLDLNYKSCEMIAQDIVRAIVDRYDCVQRKIEVTVSEDGECGATITSTPMGYSHE